MSDYELQRRLRAVERGKDPCEALQAAQEARMAAYRAFQASRTKAGIPSAHASDLYARALREVELCQRVLQIVQPLEETA